MKKEETRCVVRISTSRWCDKRGHGHEQRTIKALKRKSYGFPILEEELGNLGEDFFDEICLSNYKDGLYEIYYVGFGGYYGDDYELELRPFKEHTQ